MRVLIISPVYPPEHAPAGIMAAELAAELTRAGHGVTVLTGFPSHPSGHLFEGWRSRLFSKERIEGSFTLIRCIHSFVSRYGVAGKTWYHFTFAVSSFFAGLLGEGFDVLVFQSTPVFCGPSAICLAKLRKARTFYWIHDVHPESAIHAGLLKPGALSSVMKAVDSWICRTSDVVATITDDMRRVILERDLPGDRVIIQRHWIDEERIRPLPRENVWRQRNGISPASFVVLHAGTIGYISGASVIVEAARLLRDRAEILFLFVGDGPLKADLQRKAGEYELTNTKFLPFQPEEDLNLMQATGDIGLVTLKPLSAATSIPSKMYGYTSAGRAVVASVNPASEIARLIEEEGLGWVVPPEDPRALAGAILCAASNGHECRRRGERAREFFVREFGRSSAVNKFRRELETLWTRRTGTEKKMKTSPA